LPARLPANPLLTGRGLTALGAAIASDAIGVDPGRCYILPMPNITFDKLAYTQALRAGGFTDQQAETSAHALDNAFRDAVATRSDVAALRADIETVRVELGGELGSARTDLEHKIETVKSQLYGKIEAVRTQLEHKVETTHSQLDAKIDRATAELRQGIATQKIDLLKWLVPLLFGQAALIVAFSKLL